MQPFVLQKRWSSGDGWVRARGGGGCPLAYLPSASPRRGAAPPSLVLGQGVRWQRGTGELRPSLQVGRRSGLFGPSALAGRSPEAGDSAPGVWGTGWGPCGVRGSRGSWYRGGAADAVSVLRVSVRGRAPRVRAACARWGASALGDLERLSCGAKELKSGLFGAHAGL